LTRCATAWRRGHPFNKVAVATADDHPRGQASTVPLVVSEIADTLRPSQLLISVAASVSTAFIEKHLAAAVPVIRAMPNTPCLLNKGMTGIAPGKNASAEHVALAKFIFDSVGRTVVVDEKHMDAITGLSQRARFSLHRSNHWLKPA
jgi:pyrroline-5-carboxylate reductase